MACYYIVISSTHLSNGHFRNIKGVFRGPLGKNGSKNLDYAGKEKTMTKALEDLKANFYCELCDKQYYKHQEFDNHINSYDHAHTQRLKELKQREFARNVASKLRKDERKQERALKRLHELAEQRREVQCAPGSGPKFRSTTVAVEGVSREACCEGNVVGSQLVAAQNTGAQKNAWNTNSNKLVQWPYPGKLKKQMHRQKIAFSISLPKRASIRLEASAPVFCENMEDGLAALSSKQRLRAAADKFSLLSTPAVGNALNYGEAIYSGDTNMDLISQEKIRSETHITSEVSSNQASPDLTSDLCALLVYSADVSSPCIGPSTFPFHIKDAGIVLHMEDSQSSLRCENIERKSETVQDISSESKLDKGAVEQSQSIITDSSSPNETIAATASCEQKVADLASGAPLNFEKPSQPFCSVLNKDGSTALQWPSEMLSFTRAVPSLSFSCNPLYFDFRASRMQTEQRTTWVKENDPNHMAPLQEAHDNMESAKPEASQSSGEYIKEPARTLDSGLAQIGSHFPGSQGHQDLTAPIVVKDDHYGTHETGCLRPLKRDDNQTKKCFTKQKGMKEDGQTNRKSTGKLWGRHRRNYRSHKRRQRTSKRQLYREHDRNKREAEKFTSNLNRRSECWDDSDGEFCSNILQQSPPLDESKESSQNQEESSGDVSRVDSTGRGRCRGASAVKGTVGCQPSYRVDHCSVGEMLDCGTVHQRDVSEKQADISESCPHCLPTPPPEKHSTLEVQPPPCGQNLCQNSLKRKHSISSDEEEDRCQPPTDSLCLVGGSRSLELFSKVDSFESDSRICCRLERIRKRQRASLANHRPITDWGAASKEKHMPKVPAESISLSSAIQSPKLQKTQTNAPEKDVNEKQSWPDKDLHSDMGHDTHLLNSLTQGLPTDRCTESSSSPSGTQIKLAAPSSSPYQCTVPGDLNLTENMSPKNDVRSASPFKNNEPNAATSNQQEHDEPPTKASGWQPEVRVAMLQSSESMSHGKSFHQCQPPKRPLCFKGQEERISHEVFMMENPGGAFCSSPQGFQHPSDTTDKHCLPQAQTHRRALRPRARFRGKLKPVLSGPPIPVHSPILHHVHLPPPMSTTSITIHHTILQHHTTLLQPQSPLFSQVFPITPPPMATEICAPGPPTFIPPPELSVVAPAGLHPVAMTFHALPRSGLIPAMLPPHPTLYPLQPLF